MIAYYINNKGQIIDFNKYPFRISEEDLRDYEWDYDTLSTQSGTRITRLYRDVKSKKVCLHIREGAEISFREAMDLISQVCDYDIMHGKMGKIYVNGMYMECFVTSSKKTNFWITTGAADVELTLTASNPVWIDEQEALFEEEGSGASIKHRYPYGYPFGYPIHYFRRTVKNNGIAPADFKMRIFGPCVNPSISIAGHQYKMLASAAAGEYFEIDSFERKINLVSSTGVKTNVFEARYKPSWIFEKIPEGNSTLSADGSYRVELVIYGERSDPKWTISS